MCKTHLAYYDVSIVKLQNLRVIITLFIYCQKNKNIKTEALYYTLTVCQRVSIGI